MPVKERTFCALFQSVTTRTAGFNTADLSGMTGASQAIMIVLMMIGGAPGSTAGGMNITTFAVLTANAVSYTHLIPLSIGNAAIRSALGKLFSFKFGILITVVVLSILFYRPFCKWICPLGAIYSLFNKVSFLHITIENSKCVGCNQCSRACKMDIDVCRTPNHPECIRCGACIKACPKDAIHYQFMGKTCQKKDTGDQQSEIRNLSLIHI